MSEVAFSDAPTRAPVSSTPKPKAEKPAFGPETDAWQIAEHLWTSLASYRPNSHELPKTPADKQKWAAECDRLLRIDKRDVRRTHQLIDYVANDVVLDARSWDGWQGKVRSPSKLRTQWETLDEQESKKRRKAQVRATQPQARNEPPSVVLAPTNPFRAARKAPPQQPSSL
jgi:hypothetical protein